MKLLQRENIFSMLKDVLKGKEKVDIVKLHKSREVVPRNYKYRKHMRIIYWTWVREMMHYHDMLLNCSFFKKKLFIVTNFIYHRRFGTTINHAIGNISLIHVTRLYSPKSKHKNSSHVIINFNLLITRV